MRPHSAKAAPSPPASSRSRRSTPRAHTPNTVSPFSRWTPSIVRPAVNRPSTAGHLRPPIPPLAVPTSSTQTGPPHPAPSTQTEGPTPKPPPPHVNRGDSSARRTSSTSTTPRTSRMSAAGIQEPSELSTTRRSRVRPVSAPVRRPNDDGSAPVSGNQTAAPSESDGLDQHHYELSEANLQEFAGMQQPESEQFFWKRRFFSQMELDGAGPSSFEVVMSGAEPNQLASDYLTWYYCDFFETDPVEQLPLTEQNTTTVTKIVEWLNRFRPRTRIDAYPMLQVAMDVISKLTRNELKVEYEHYDAFQAEIESVQRLANERKNVIDTLQVENEQLNQIVTQLKGTIQHMSDTHQAKLDRIKEAAEKREAELSSALNEVTKSKDEQIEDLEKNLTVTKEDLFHFKSQLARCTTESKAFQKRMISLQIELRGIEARKDLEKVMALKGQKEDKRLWIFQNIARTSITAHFTSWKVVTKANIKLGLQQEGGCKAIRRRVDYRFLLNIFVGWDGAVTGGNRYRAMCRTALQRACKGMFKQWADAVGKVKWEGSVQRARELMRRTMDRSVASITKAWAAWAQKMGHYTRISNAILGHHQLRLLRVGFRILRQVGADNLLQQTGWRASFKDSKPLPRKPAGSRSPRESPYAASREGRARDGTRSPARSDSSARLTPRDSSPRGQKKNAKREFMAAAVASASARSALGIPGQSPIAQRLPVDLAGMGSRSLTKTSDNADHETFIKLLQLKAQAKKPGT